jgi:hypothetical protein
METQNCILEYKTVMVAQEPDGNTSVETTDKENFIQVPTKKKMFTTFINLIFKHKSV